MQLSLSVDYVHSIETGYKKWSVFSAHPSHFEYENTSTYGVHKPVSNCNLKSQQ